MTRPQPVWEIDWSDSGNYDHPASNLTGFVRRSRVRYGCSVGTRSSDTITPQTASGFLEVDDPTHRRFTLESDVLTRTQLSAAHEVRMTIAGTRVWSGLAEPEVRGRVALNETPRWLLRGRHYRSLFHEPEGLEPFEVGDLIALGEAVEQFSDLPVTVASDRLIGRSEVTVTGSWADLLADAASWAGGFLAERSDGSLRVVSVVDALLQAVSGTPLPLSFGPADGGGVWEFPLLQRTRVRMAGDGEALTVISGDERFGPVDLVVPPWFGASLADGPLTQISEWARIRAQPVRLGIFNYSLWESDAGTGVLIALEPGDVVQPEVSEGVFDTGIITEIEHSWQDDAEPEITIWSWSLPTEAPRNGLVSLTHIPSIIGSTLQVALVPRTGFTSSVRWRLASSTGAWTTRHQRDDGQPSVTFQPGGLTAGSRYTAQATRQVGSNPDWSNPLEIEFVATGVRVGELLVRHNVTYIAVSAEAEALFYATRDTRPVSVWRLPLDGTPAEQVLEFDNFFGMAFVGGRLWVLGRPVGVTSGRQMLGYQPDALVQAPVVLGEPTGRRWTAGDGWEGDGGELWAQTGSPNSITKIVGLPDEARPATTSNANAIAGQTRYGAEGSQGFTLPARSNGQFINAWDISDDGVWSRASARDITTGRVTTFNAMTYVAGILYLASFDGTKRAILLYDVAGGRFLPSLQEPPAITSILVSPYGRAVQQRPDLFERIVGHTAERVVITISVLGTLVGAATRTITLGDPGSTTSVSIQVRDGSDTLNATLRIHRNATPLPAPEDTTPETPGTQQPDDPITGEYRAPTASITATRTRLTAAGQTTRLSWTSANGVTATLNGQQVARADSRTLTASTLGDGTHVFTLVVIGQVNPDTQQAESATASVTITVTGVGPRPQPEPPVARIRASAETVTVGEQVGLTWTTVFATSVTITGIGTVPANGTRRITPPLGRTVYTIVATNNLGTASDSVAVTAVEPPPNVSFTVTDDNPAEGETYVLRWTVTGATTVRLNSIVVTARGSRQLTARAIPSRRTFTLRATGPGGEVVRRIVVTTQT